MDMKQAESWLTWLYADALDAGAGNISIVSHVNFRGGRFTSIPDAVDYAASMDERCASITMGGVYHRLTTVNDTAERRGVDEDSVWLPAVMLDLDLRGPGHKADTYPETIEDLAAVLADAGLPEPSAWVNSGGGRYPVWKLSTPILLTSSETAFLVGQQGLRDVQRAVKLAAAARGWKLDNTSDLARVYRLPGTTNRKGPEPVMATWEMATGEGYLLSDLIGNLAQRAPEPVAERAVSSLFADAYAGGEIVRSSVNQSSLFAPDGGRSHSGERTFTVGQAMTFVKPFLDALAAAPDGEINVRLNDAACALAHFGPEFWDADAADRQLQAALDLTVYDGMTWKAEDTIASARRGMASDWRAALVHDPVEVGAAIEAVVESAPMDAVDALLAEMLDPSEIISRPPPRFLIRDLLQLDSESWIIGPPGSKKSFVVLDMAAAVLRGVPWQGFETNAADVVMIVAEGAGGMGKRLKAWERRHGAMPPGMRILPRPVQASKPEAWGVLVAACARLAASARERERGMLVVLDTQARVTVGMKENDATDMGVFIGAVSSIREHTGGCVLTVHHTGRSGGDARGSSAIDGAQTTELKVNPKGKLTAKLTVEKQKDIEEIEPVDLAFEIVEVGQDERGGVITSLVLADRESAAFRAAWSGGEAGPEDVEDDGGRAVNPLTYRTAFDPWIVGRMPQAKWHHRIVQVLVDTAGTLGLTQSETRKAVAEKYGAADTKTWLRAWQAVTDESGAWTDVVVSAGGQRWTVDHLRASELLTAD